MASKRNGIMLCLIRCGDTSWVADRRMQGFTDLPMSESGRTEVSAAAKRLLASKLGVISHPTDEAATETAAIFAQAHKSRMRQVPELADPNLGLLEGLTEQEFAERFPRRFKQWQDDPLAVSPPEGEPLVDARARIFAAVARILKRSRSDAVAVVLHSLGLGLLRCWLADRPSQDLWDVLKEDRPRVERYALTTPMIQWMEEAAAAVTSRS